MGKTYLLVAVDRTSDFAHAYLYRKMNGVPQPIRLTAPSRR